jgi:hypothetical protein
MNILIKIIYNLMDNPEIDILRNLTPKMKF